MATQKTTEIEPGEPILTTHYPCCGAHLEIVHGEDEGEVIAIGTPKMVLVSEE